MNIIDKPSLKGRYYRLKQKINDFYNESELIQTLVNNREIGDLKHFLEKKVSTFWPKLQDIPNLRITIDFLEELRSNNKKIGIVGDYDVDGVSATSLLIKIFQIMKIDYEYIIPNRFVDGYGISIDIVKRLGDVNAIITVDNGTTAYDVIDYLNENRIPMIIIDHHNIQCDIDVKYFVNPHLDLNSPYRILCATALTFIVLSEWNKVYNHRINMKEFIDLVGLATVCDVMPLTNINRALVDYSIKKIREKPMEFIYYLIGDDHMKMDVRKLGFMVGPHINAPGRMGKTNLALDFILNPNKENFSQIVLMNHERRKKEQLIYQEVEELIDETKSSIIVANETWHEGIIGIVAGRLKERFIKPALVLTKNDGKWKGSFRSTDKWHVGNFIKKMKAENVILYGGGHAKAGGIVLEDHKLCILKDHLYKDTEDLEEEYIFVDNICSLSILNKDLQTSMEMLSPFGEANPQPLFFFANCLIVNFQIVNEKDCRFFITNIITNRTIVTRIFDIYSSDLENLCRKNLNVHIIGSLEKGFLNIKDAIII